MARLTNKKINKARTTYETYCKVNTLEKTKEVTGLAINTIRRYIALVEDIDNRSKLSKKDRYYNTKDILNKDINIKEDISKVKDNKNDVGTISLNNNISLKKTKNKILLSKLDTISTKYLGYLDNPTKDSLAKTSLKDRAVIAGILLDKKILLEHKQADVIRNQSVIFNLFGSNKELASFISNSLDRKKKLEARPVKKYVLATGK